MYLKSLEMHGFKSFSQKTVLEFMKNNNGRYSITGVVGPNGAGKSNIVDAVRWVMGEQSMKTLRGKKGEDIIFSGSESKGKMGLASVTLTLDNTDGKLPIDFEELVITRRYYRSGDSEYIINGKSVRLLDLQLLLAKAQFGQSSYGVIGQGMIDRLLLQTPQERKDFFDEACGIKEFQIKRHQAALKLHRTRENLDQADLLLNEVAPRLRSLSRQVKKLEKRQDVELQLREAQEQYYTTLYKYNQSQLDELNSELAGINKEYAAASQRLSSLQEELGKLAREESRQEVFAQLQQKYRDIVREKNTLEREQAVLAGKLQTEYSKAGKQNVGWLQKKISELQIAQEKLARDLTEAENLVEKSAAQILNQRQKIEKMMVERTEVRGRIVNIEQRLMQLKSEQSFLQYSGLKAVQAVLEERHRLGNIYGTVAQLGEVDEKYRLALDVAGSNHLSSIIVDNDRTAQTCIEYLRRQQLGIATFLPLNKIKPRLMSQDVQGLINKKGVHGLAVDLVKFDNKFSDIFSYALGNTLIVEDMNVARVIGIGRVRMVTLTGDIVEVSGSMKGGYRKKGQNRGLSFSYGDSSFLLAGNLGSQEEELEDWQKKLGEAERNYEKAQEGLHELQSQVHLAGGKADLLGRQKQDLDRELASLQQELAQHEMSPEEYGQSLRGISQQKDGLDKQIIALDRDLQHMENKIGDFNKQEESKKQRIFELQEIMQAEQGSLNKIVDERNQKRVAVAKLETKQEDLAQEVYQEMHIALSAISERGVKIIDIDGLELLQQEIQKMKYQLSLIGGIDDEVIAEYQETKERHDFLATQLDDLQKALENLEKLVVELDEIMKKKRDKAFKQIKKEFARYFELLFEGGKADLVELYGEVDEEVDDEEVIVEVKPVRKRGDKLLMGIDVVACPPGKKIKNLQALSGGERTLTSLALLCAVLYTNPSPFVVLDEVEAALDEANTERFNKILHELAVQSQFIVITHNRVTMHAADALYGVTMGNEGISHLLSVKLSEAEKVAETELE